MSYHRLGSADVYIEDDLIFSVVGARKDDGADKSQRFFEIVEPVFKKYPHVFHLTDARRGFSLNAAARRTYVEWGKTHAFAASAVFGAGTMTRGLLELTSRAISLFGKPLPMKFCDTEAEARAWLAQQRVRLQRSAAAAAGPAA
jgi:hypothetical protein